MRGVRCAVYGVRCAVCGVVVKLTVLFFHRVKWLLIVIESSILSPRLEFQSTTVNPVAWENNGHLVCMWKVIFSSIELGSAVHSPS